MVGKRVHQTWEVIVDARARAFRKLLRTCSRITNNQLGLMASLKLANERRSRARRGAASRAASHTLALSGALIAATGLGAGFALGKAGNAGAEQAAHPGDAKMCVLTPEAMEGPFYFDPQLVRSDITEGKQGAPLVLTLLVVEAKDCAAIPGARVDIWHADGLGLYSGYARQETGSAKGETFLRGTQSPGLAEKCASPPSILAGIQVVRRIFTSKYLSTTSTWLPASSTFPIPSLSMSTQRPCLIVSGRVSGIPLIRTTLFSQGREALTRLSI